jgi:DNA modification methylase
MTLLASLQNVHTSKRGTNEQKGLHSWHSYYAGYSEQFVVDILEKLPAKGALVLDPWNGSGTTTYVAQRLGFSSLGFDINPIVTIHARAKTVFSDDVALLRERAQRIVASVGKLTVKLPSDDDPVHEFFDSSALRPLLKLRAEILAGNQLTRTNPLQTKLMKRRYGANEDWHPHTSFLLSALFQCLRRVGNFHAGSNPTWLVRNGSGFMGSEADVLRMFSERVDGMLADLTQSDSTANNHQALVLECNAKRLPLCRASTDIVITSPPYCTRIDYVVSTRPELTFMGSNVEQITALRKATMGAPVIARRTGSSSDAWGRTCVNFLREVEGHASKASKSYYLPVFLQYFSDAYSSLLEIKRVLKPKGNAVMVVQSSYYKDVKLPLGEVYIEMARSLGFDATIAKTQPVRQSMAHLNRKSQFYVKRKSYQEDVLLFRKDCRGSN